MRLLIYNGKTSRYTYNAAGERIVKSHGYLEGVYVNGAPQGLTFHETEDYTIYPAPILSVTRQRFTKHYFIGDRRVASKIGAGIFQNAYGHGANVVTAGQKDYQMRMMQIEKQREDYYRKLGTPPGVPTMKGATAEPENTHEGYNTIIKELGDHSVPDGWIQRPKRNAVPGTPPGPPVQWDKAEDPDDVQPGYGYVPADTTHEDIFFYHSDHLGSTSYITDAKANVAQFDAYLPYGELLVDEHSSMEEMPYKFNGKELDQETGLYYYGARYMNPRTSLWYGVDPLVEKYPSVGGYVYCVGNPIRYFDPDGKQVFTNNKVVERGGVYYLDGHIVGEKPLERNHIEFDLILSSTSAAKSTVDFIGRKVLAPIGKPIANFAQKIGKNAIGRLRNLTHKVFAKSLGKARTEFKTFLKNVGNMDRPTLEKTLQKFGFKRVFSGKGITHYAHKNLKIRIDPPQEGTPYNHLHINYGGNKNAYDVNLRPVNYKEPAAHIKLKE